ncbi:prephenate dehydrogenase [Actinomadura rubteroloni]|uniref:Prephenate dehydrogenase n=2 Tax=Actinomadura rubteroloni TaxID=1926885 RepID=A0A2P4UIW7_9ACTN|nr:prephenate dehydrogenase [Actinomadura rubteroloni]
MCVVGTGLIGTSVALAARRRGVAVYLSDRDPVAARTAAALGAGRAEPPPGPVDLAVLAVPPSRVAAVLAERQGGGLARAYTDVASVKSAPECAVLATAPDPSQFVGGHPLGGRERSGPLAATAELFHGRPWALVPHAGTAPDAFDLALDLVALCGAAPVVLSAREHDETVALTSHVPHLAASLMAARLLDGPAGTPLLAGQGLRDTTRIAGGSARLWADILRGNAAAVAAVLRALNADVSALVAAFDALGDADGPAAAAGLATLTDLLERGVAGLGEVAAPRVDGPADTVPVRVRCPGRPGELARLLAAAAPFGGNTDNAAVTAAPDLSGRAPRDVGADVGAGTGAGERVRDPGAAAAGADAVLDVRFAVPAPTAAGLAAGLRAGGWDARAEPSSSPAIHAKKAVADARRSPDPVRP